MRKIKKNYVSTIEIMIIFAIVGLIVGIISTCFFNRGVHVFYNSDNDKFGITYMGRSVRDGNNAKWFDTRKEAEDYCEKKGIVNKK